MNAPGRSAALRRLAGRGALRARPRRPAGGGRRIGGRIAGWKRLFELLVELLLRFRARLARRRLARLFHPGGSVEGLRRRTPAGGSFAPWRGRDPYRSKRRGRRGLGDDPWDRAAIYSFVKCAILRATQAFQALNLIFLQLGKTFKRSRHWRRQINICAFQIDKAERGDRDESRNRSGTGSNASLWGFCRAHTGAGRKPHSGLGRRPQPPGEGPRLRHSVSGETIALPSAALRAAPITLMGSGLGSVPPDRLLAAIGAALEAAASGGFKLAAKPVPLSEVQQALERR